MPVQDAKEASNSFVVLDLSRCHLQIWAHPPEYDAFRWSVLSETYLWSVLLSFGWS